MIEREFLKENVDKFNVEKYFKREWKDALISHVDVVKTIEGYKIFVHCKRPRMIASNIQKVLEDVKQILNTSNIRIITKFVENDALNAQIQASRIARALERGEMDRIVAMRVMRRVLASGAKGIEIVISGKLGKKGARSKTRRYVQGYVIKTGGYAKLVSRGFDVAYTKSGVIGVKVRIVPPNLHTIDTMDIRGVIDEAKRNESQEVEGNEQGGTGETAQ